MTAAMQSYQILSGFESQGDGALVTEDGLFKLMLDLLANLSFYYL